MAVAVQERAIMVVAGLEIVAVRPLAGNRATSRRAAGSLVVRSLAPDDHQPTRVQQPLLMIMTLPHLSLCQ